MFASADSVESFEAFIGVAIVFIFIGLILAALGVLGYIFHSLSLYTIAKRRGILHPWLAWIPVGEAWILGSISDQYQYHAKGKLRNRDKLLLALNVALVALLIPFGIGEIMLVVPLDSATGIGAMGVGLTVLVYLAYFVLSVVTMVFTYIAMYDLYVSCDPDNATLFLVLGIFFDIIQPIFLFICRKKDLGMSPRNQPELLQKDCEEEINLL